MKFIFSLFIILYFLSCQQQEQVDLIVTNAIVYTVNDSFDNAEAFYQHYISSYGGGTANDRNLQDLRQIMGKKLFRPSIRAEDECRITLIQRET